MDKNATIAQANADFDRIVGTGHIGKPVEADRAAYVHAAVVMRFGFAKRVGEVSKGGFLS